jgi:hypothetical protein
MPRCRKLSLADQRKLIRTIPADRRVALRKCCKDCEQRGYGIKTTIKKAGEALGFIGREIGPTVLKELILPLLKKKTAGRGLRLAGAGGKKSGGRGLTLSGAGKRKGKKRKTKRKKL